jgi:exonuclease SbcD
MRIFHTADWHLGQTLHDFERDYEHSRFLEWLLEQIIAREPDALLIAGDVFDSVNPPATAHRMYFDFLGRAAAARPGLQIVVTAGNHDAAARLEAPATLLNRFNVHVVGTVERGCDGAIDYGKFLVPLHRISGGVGALVLAVPYLRPSDVPQIRDVSDPYTEGICAFYQRLTDMAASVRDERYAGAVLLGMGHCHLMDGAESKDSERRLVVGGLEALRSEAFPRELCYVALGHLHKPQAFDHGRVAYSGSPIPLSFAERGYEHRVWEVEIGAEGVLERRSLEIPRTVPLLRLPAGPAVAMNELERILKNTDFAVSASREQHPFLEVRCLDDGPDPTRRPRIERALAGKPVRLVNIKFEPVTKSGEADATGGFDGLGDLHSVDPYEVLRASYREYYEGAEPGEELWAAFREILTEVSL